MVTNMVVSSMIAYNHLCYSPFQNSAPEILSLQENISIWANAISYFYWRRFMRFPAFIMILILLCIFSQFSFSQNDQEPILEETVEILGVQDPNPFIASVNLVNHVNIHFITSGGTDNDDDLIIHSARINQKNVYEGKSMPDQRFRRFWKVNGGASQIKPVVFRQEANIAAAKAKIAGYLLLVQTPQNQLGIFAERYRFLAIPFNQSGKRVGAPIELFAVNAPNKKQSGHVDFPSIVAAEDSEGLTVFISYMVDYGYEKYTRKSFAYALRMGADGRIIKSASAVKLPGNGNNSRVKLYTPFFAGHWLVPVSTLDFKVQTKPLKSYLVKGHRYGITRAVEKEKNFTSTYLPAGSDTKTDWGLVYQSMKIMRSNYKNHNAGLNNLRLFVWSHTGGTNNPVDKYLIYRLQKSGNTNLRQQGIFDTTPPEAWDKSYKEVKVHEPLDMQEGSAVIPIEVQYLAKGQTNSSSISTAGDAEKLKSAVLFYLLLKFNIIKNPFTGESISSSIRGYFQYDLPMIAGAIALGKAGEIDGVSKGFVVLAIGLILVLSMFKNLN
jgi:hypothetical protein